jgi:hypothetical protein
MHACAHATTREALEVESTQVSSSRAGRLRKFGQGKPIQVDSMWRRVRSSAEGKYQSELGGTG